MFKSVCHEKTPGFLVTVEESGEKHRRYVAGAAMPSESARADMANAGMMPIVTAGRRLYRASLSEAGTAMVLAGPPLVYGLVVLWTARKRRFAEDRPYARSYRAKSRMRKRLRGVVNAADPADALCRAVNGYIADKFDLPEAGMTPADVRDLLEGRAIQHESAAKLLEILCCWKGDGTAQRRFRGRRLNPSLKRLMPIWNAWIGGSRRNLADGASVLYTGVGRGGGFP